MRLSSTIIFLAGASSVLGTKCIPNDCLRAIRASAYPTNTQDCESYFLTTVTPKTKTHHTTVTTTVTEGETNIREAIATPATVLNERQVTVAPSNIPYYATPCSGAVKYSSACSCIGVTASTTTAPTPSTTITVTKTKTAAK